MRPGRSDLPHQVLSLSVSCWRFQLFSGWFPLLLMLLFATSAGGQESQSDFREILALAGWDEAAYAQFTHAVPLSESETVHALKLLRRLRSFDVLSLERWTNRDIQPGELADHPQAYRAELIWFAGRVVHVEQVRLAEHDAARLEMQDYHLCDIITDEGNVLTEVITGNVPRAWLGVENLDEPVAVSGIVLKCSSDNPTTSQLVVVAPHVAWYPTAASPANPSFAQAVLGSCGFDVGLLADIRNSQAIRGEEREAFYQMLFSMSHVGPQQLIRFAERNLSWFAKRWEEKLEVDPRDRLAQAVVRQAEQGQFSVAALFNDADSQIGNLVVLEGVVRRAVRIEVGSTGSGQLSDIARRFEIEHYFELDLFTEDSQNHPVVFCVLDLPSGFPVGAKIHEPVRMAGFYFKSWLHHARQGKEAEQRSASRRQLAPLLISPGPVWIKDAVGQASVVTSLIAGGIVVLAFVGVWVAVWWFGRSDREFHRRAIATQYALPQGESLDDLVVSSGIDTPNFSNWEDEVEDEGPHPP
jgi:hypothetical protein